MKTSYNTQSYLPKEHLKRSLSLDILRDTHTLRLKYTFSQYFLKTSLPKEEASSEEKQPWLKKIKPSLEISKPWSQEQCIKNEFLKTRKKEGLYLYIQNKDDAIILGRSRVKQNEEAQPNPNQEDIAEKHNDMFPKNNPHIVKCAGEMIFAGNPLPIYMNNKSGHFRPSSKTFMKFVQKLYVKELLSSATEIEILEKSTTSKEQENKTLSQKGIANEILNMPFQDWHYNPFRKKPFDE